MCVIVNTTVLLIGNRRRTRDGADTRRADMAPDLADMFNECSADGQLTPSMMLRKIILLYKEKDPRDVRNYQPTTLLNLDYKVLAKILVCRLKKVIDKVIT